jgi:Cu-processing system ATP-binding protein
MITVSQLTKKFGSFTALNDLTMEFKPGMITAVLGPNGSGKTTLMKTILGLVRPDKGELLFDGSPLLRDPLLRSRIGYMPQTGRFPDNLKIPDLIKLVGHLRGATADASELYHYFDLLPHLNKPIGNLSGGMRQKLSAVLAFVFDADVIILDEPTAGLDPGSAIKLKKLIVSEKEKGKTIIFTSHIIHVVEEIADEIVFLLEGIVYYKGTIHAMNTMHMQQNLEHSIAALIENKERT